MRGVSFVSVGAVRVAVMLSYEHEVLVEMFRDRPALAAELTGLFSLVPTPQVLASVTDPALAKHEPELGVL
jgi:hypothetical protein